jgi:hypothetical protein
MLKFYTNFLSKSNFLLRRVLLCSLLSACATYPVPPFLAYPVVSAHEFALQQRLVRQGLRFIQLGDEVKLLIPAYPFFAANGVSLKKNHYALLDGVIQLLNQRVVYSSISIRAYPSERQPEIARQQAIVIADYLVQRGLKAPILHTHSNQVNTAITRAKRFMVLEYVRSKICSDKSQLR